MQLTRPDEIQRQLGAAGSERGRKADAARRERGQKAGAARDPGRKTDAARREQGRRARDDRSRRGSGAGAARGRRRRRADGERSHNAILLGATELATLEGLEGLSIGGLADHIGMSKSGLYAHFGSKEELQLATIEKAQEIFDREVTRPALEQPQGLSRVLGMSDAYLSYLERRVFPGGCFFAAAGAEFATRDGPVKQKLQEFATEGLRGLAEAIRAARAHGEIDADADADQLAFEIDALLHGANAGFLLSGDREPLDRARRAIRERLGVSGT
jgi:AcrR family transcriptional regulator